jgi:CTD nuclear envelope phosphatase 1
MNSLTYISRKFDVLAARTPPNTPTTEFASHSSLPLSSSADDSTVKHRTAEHTAWSLRSLVAPPPPPRRSLSSPARVPVLRRRPSTRSAIRAKPQSTGQGLFRRFFLVRLLELVWHALCTAAASLRVDDVWHGRRSSPRGLRLRRKSVALGLGKEPSADEREGMATPAHQVTPEQTLSTPELAAKSSVSAHTPSSAVNALPVSRISTDPPAPGATHFRRPSMAYTPPQPIAALMPTPPPSRTPTPTYSTNAGLPITPRKTPFHLPKTLVLDLDETLIHSTSRPLPAPGIRGLFGARRAAHTVEVVMGGRSTLYHVYKRPFVDFFLRKVRVTNRGHSFTQSGADNRGIGIGVSLVYARDFHCLDARVRRSSHRLARCRAGHSRTQVLS